MHSNISWVTKKSQDHARARAEPVRPLGRRAGDGDRGFPAPSPPPALAGPGQEEALPPRRRRCAPRPLPETSLPCASQRPLTPSPRSLPGDLWALLIAGSAGWGNYRHQADVAHAYQVLHHGGIPDERIVVMVFDDIAGNPENPRPGTLINHPQGPDVYSGMPRDYTGANVNAAAFLAVLTGDSAAVPAANGPGVRSSGKVIAAGPADRIFVFYSDHGAPGIVGMPSGDFLYADALHTAIKGMAQRRAFGEMALYIEACESGSMFKGLLEDDLAVWASTAANERESSWGTYCPGMDPPPPPEYSTCLGDLYSVAWMEDSDGNDLNVESLKKQYQRVRLRVSQNYTYAQGSHVERFGELEMDEEAAARFLGELNAGPGPAPNAAGARAPWTPVQGAVPQREADLVPLVAAAARGEAGAAARLAAERRRRAELDAAVLEAVAAAAGAGNLSGLLGAERLLTELVPAPRSEALVDDWDCLRGMVGAWGAACGPLDQYGMRHTRAFANLCNLGVVPEALGAAAAASCGAAAVAEA